MKELLKKLAEEFEDAEYAHAYLHEQSNIRIAAQLRALRQSLDLTQAQLAEISSMRQERISKIEMTDFDSLSLSTLRRLAQALDVNLNVEFSSIADAVQHFINMHPETLICERRDQSLARMRAMASAPVAAVTIPDVVSGNLQSFGPVSGGEGLRQLSIDGRTMHASVGSL